MHITRMNAARDLSKDVDVLDVELSNGKRFRLREFFDGIKISELDGKILSISPCCGNEITVTSQD